ncbi:MAG: anthranilate synthase component I [Emcibacteraceae bacterium]|nr:anthranilate synthase component I [Emcibacteraceae bacterium]MDG1995657.1 anthranilate synthase component I [Emcibacteraceae bacterium]
MATFPEKSDFEKSYNAGKATVLWTTMVADLETSVSAYLKLATNENGEDENYASLLESVEGGAIRGRYTFIGLKPDILWRAEGNSAEINRKALSGVREQDFVSDDRPTLESLRALFAESLIDLPEGMPPSAAGLIGYMGYDCVRLMEKLPDAKPDVIGTPDSMFMRPTIMVVFDSVTDLITIVTPVRPNDPTRPTNDVNAHTAYTRAEERLNDIIARLCAPLNSQTIGNSDIEFEEPTSNTSKDEYAAMVATAKEYISAGDVFQVVLSQRFSMPFNLPPFSLYRALRRTNPSPFLYYLKFGDFSIVGSSPEILVRLRDDEVTIRPIAGTRPRGKDAAEDRKNAEDLLSDPKECAEHLMLLDLGRNDVGRVSKVGTVNVTERMIIEYYSHVMHIVSNVTGEIADGYDALKALAAGFPAGTVSGAPKVRAMEIIDELEKEKRGIYAGAVGYFSADGSMDTAIVLRTAIVKDETLYVQAGAGIVADSTWESEYAECEHKAKALVRAAEEAVQFAELGSGQ